MSHEHEQARRPAVLTGWEPRRHVILYETPGSSDALGHGPSATTRWRFAALSLAFHARRQRRSDGARAPKAISTPTPSTATLASATRMHRITLRC